MIPKQMNAFLREHLPESSWQNRLVREEGMCFMEFGPADIDRLTRLGIQIDSLGREHRGWPFGERGKTRWMDQIRGKALGANL